MSCKCRHCHIQANPVFPQMFLSQALKGQHHLVTVDMISSHIFQQATSSQRFYNKLRLTILTGHFYSILRVSGGPRSGWCYEGRPLQVGWVNRFVQGSSSFHALHIFINHILKDTGVQTVNFTICTLSALRRCFLPYVCFVSGSTFDCQGVLRAPGNVLFISSGFKIFNDGQNETPLWDSLRGTEENLNPDRQYHGRDQNRRAPEEKAATLPLVINWWSTVV